MKRADIDILDAYFRDSMSDEQQALFKKRLGDPQFQAHLQEYRELHLGIEYSIFKTTREKLKSLEKTLPDPLPNRSNSKKKAVTSLISLGIVWKAAASILIVAFSTVVWVKLQQPISSEELFADYFEPFSNEFVVVQRSDDSENDLEAQAFLAYDNAQYQEAVSGFQSILQKQPDNIMVLFYLSNAQLALQDHEGAITNLQRFLEISEDFKIQAQWFLALAYLSNQQIAEARMVLEEIKDDITYGAQASEILEQLSSE